jgi:serine protease DegQ
VSRKGGLLSTSGSFVNAMEALSAAAADVARGVSPSIVQVHGRPRRPASGIVIAPERVLTTSHSVEWEEGLSIRTDAGEIRPATAAGHHEGLDLVLLRVPGLDAPSLVFASGEARMGELALLAGRSWRGDSRVRLITVCGSGGPLQVRDGTRIERLLVLSAGPYPGFSGSAVISGEGTLLGIATAGLVRGTAVAVPGTTIAAAVKELEEHGGVRRGFLGVTSQPVRLPPRQKDLSASGQGLVILGIAGDSPAERDGLLVGDIMVQAAGARLETPEDLLALLTPDRVGQPLALTILRGAAVENVTVTVGQRLSRS